MFMGDASSTTEKEIMSIYNLPDIDVLKLGIMAARQAVVKNLLMRWILNIQLLV